jgi:hypothetical protein
VGRWAVSRKTRFAVVGVGLTAIPYAAGVIVALSEGWPLWLALLGTLGMLALCSLLYVVTVAALEWAYRGKP